MNIWIRWKLAMRSFLHCVEEGYRKSVIAYAEPKPIYNLDDDPGSTSTQLVEETE